MKRCLTLVAGLVVIGCDPSATPEPSAGDGLGAFDGANGAGAAFSASYVAEPPAGERPQIIITPAFDDPCSTLYEDEERVENLDFWFIKIVLAERSPGRYAVVDGEDPGPDQATATLQHALHGKTESRIAAIGRVVEVDQPMFDTGAELAVELTLDFPAAPAITVECNVDATEDGEVRTCLCEDAGGARSECVASTTQSCCESNADVGVDSITLRTGAAFCSRMCNGLVGLEGYCHSLP